jgi:hypothetical protein
METGTGTKQIRVHQRAHQRAFGILPKDPASALRLLAFLSGPFGILPEGLLSTPTEHSSPDFAAKTRGFRGIPAHSRLFGGEDFGFGPPISAAWLCLVVPSRAKKRIKNEACLRAFHASFRLFLFFEIQKEI